MKPFLTVALVLIFGSALISCRDKKNKAPKDEETAQNPPPVTYPSYSALKTGNYWIYELFQVQSNGVYSSLKQFDSTYVEKDTVIRGRTYYKLKTYDFLFHRPNTLYLRDSLHYIVNSNGTIMFSSEDFNTQFSERFVTTMVSDTLPPDTICRVTAKMANRDEVINVPAGAFASSDFQLTYHFYPAWHNNSIANPRYRHTRYGKNVGLIAETQELFVSIDWVYEKRLIRYKVN